MKKTFALFLLMLALPAFAHPGHDANPLQDGLLHPLTGLDHLLMLLGTGVLAALTRRSLTLPSQPSRRCSAARYAATCSAMCWAWKP